MSETENQVQSESKRGLLSFLRRKDEKKKKSWKRELLEWVLTAAAALVIALVVRSFLFEPVVVDGDSMYPTLRHGEIMYVSKTDYGTGFFGTPFTNIGWRFPVGGEPERNDVVVCYYADEEKNVVKRLVGLPGDTVELRKNPDAVRKDGGNIIANDRKTVCDLYVNGVLVDEDFIYHEANERFDPFIVPKKGDLVNPQTRSAYSAEELEKYNIVVYETSYTDLKGKAIDADNLPKGAFFCMYDAEGALRSLYGTLVTDEQKEARDVVIITTEYFDRDGNPIAQSDLPLNAVLATRCEEDQYFLMGDNRTNSLDSRSKRTVSRGDIVGTVEAVLWHTIPNDLSDNYMYNVD